MRIAISLGIFLLSFMHILGGEDKVIRAAIDIGMGGTKLQVAEVDVNTNIVTKILHTQRYFVRFYTSIAATGALSESVMEEGSKAFNDAIEVAKTFNSEGIVAIATASFRNASNGVQFAQHLEKETGIKIHIIDQSLEGILTFQAVLSKTNIDQDQLIVWDIGGGSIQFTTKVPDGSFLVTGLTHGGGSFIDYIIQDIQGRNIHDYKSPNPMSSQDIVQATAYARTLAEKVADVLKNKITQTSTSIVGAGSVFAFGVAPKVGNKSPFSVEDLAFVVQALDGKTDADFGGGDYAFCEGSTVILTLGLMQGLNIDTMQIVNVNNADGALTYPPFWE